MAVLGRRTSRVAVEMELHGTPLTFILNGRRLALGDHASIDYYWMDASAFRRKTFSANFRNCMLHASAVSQAMGWHDTEQTAHLIWALCYPPVSREKSLQRVYKDAFLKKQRRGADAHLSEYYDQLPTFVEEDIRGCLESRDRFGVKHALDSALGRFEPPARLLPLLQQACQQWLGRGITLFREHQFGRFVDEMELWLRRYRRTSGNAWVRHFVNLFAYEAKTSFYRCYANAWVDIIPWLKQHRDLDEVSERFLRLWHNQNQPVDIPHGRTLSGVIYPTRGGRLFLTAEPSNNVRPHPITWQTEHIGPTHVPDVFSGQVLSLHPLSAVIMKDPALLALVGRFFGTDAYERFFMGGERDCAEYWEFVGVIVTAAFQYRRALDRQNQSRATTRSAREEDGAIVNSLSISQFVQEFAVARSIQCPACRGSGEFLDYQQATDTQANLHFRCRDCGTAYQHMVELADLLAHVNDE